MIKIIEIKNPFEPRREVREVEYTGGTIYSYLDIREKEIYLNGILVVDPINCFPQDGNEIVVTPIIGKGLKSILGMVASIALAVYAPQIASSWLGIAKGATVAGSMALKLGLLTGAIMTVGGRIINSVFKMNQQPIGGSEMETSNSYGWTLPSVQTYEGGVIGETYGEVLPAPQLLMSHVETTNSDDQDKNVQYLNLLYSGGWGPVDEIKDIRIDTTGIENFSDVKIETRLGTNNQEPISFFPSTVLDQQVGITLKEGNSVVRTTDTTKAKKIELTFEWPSGLYSINDEGNYTNNTAEFSIEYRKAGDSIWQSFTQDTSAQQEKRSYYLERLLLKSNKNEVWTITPKGTDTWGVMGTIHGKLGDAKTGAFYDSEYISFKITNNNKKVFNRLNRQPITVKAQQSTYQLTKSTSEAVRRTYEFYMPEAGRYDIRVTATKLPSSTRKVANMQWSLLSSFIMDSAYSRPGKVLVGLRIKATDQLSGSLPAINWRQVRSKVWVYDYTIGNYVEKNADNPIWAAYDMLHNCKRLYNINSKQEEFVVEGIPKEKFKAYWDEWVEAADYADELVTTTAGEQEKRFKFDAFLDTTRTRWEAAQKAASTGRGTIIRHGVNYGIKIDKPSTIVQVFGEGQIKQGSFKGQYSSRNDRARSIQITYYDTQNDFKNSVFMLRSPNYIDDLTKVDNTADISLFGVTRRTQAYRDGMYALKTNELQLQTITFSTDIEGMVCEYGDIIGVNHAVGHFGEASGRIAKVEGNKVFLDKEVVLNVNKQYSLVVRLQDDTLVTRDIVAVSSKVVTNELTVSMAFDSNKLPKRYDPYAFGVKSKEVKPFRITKIEKNGDNQVTIVATEYDARVYDVDYTNYSTVDYTNTDQNDYQVNDVAVKTETNIQSDGTILNDIIVDWKAPKSNYCKNIKIYYKTFESTATNAVLHNVRTDEVYTIKIVCTNDVGVIGNAVIKTISVKGKESPPDDVKNFKAEQDATNGSIVHLTWDANKDLDLDGYRIYVGDDIAVELVRSTTQLMFIPQSGEYTYGIRAIDTSGNESVNKTVTTLHAIVNAGNVAIPEAPKNLFVTMDKNNITVNWDAVINSYVDYYEVRTNAQVGQKEGLILKTNNITNQLKLTSRRGVLYVYAHNPVKGYGEASVINYNFPMMPAPIIHTNSIVKGVSVIANSFPQTAKAMRLYITGSKETKILESPNTIYDYFDEPGIYKIVACYVDILGEGRRSGEQLITITAKIDESMLDKENLGLDEIEGKIKNIDSVTKGLDSQINRLEKAVDSKILDAKNNISTRITQLDNAIKSQVLTGDKVMSAITQYKGGTRIDGKLLHITGDALFDNNIITKNMIQAGAITSDKMSINELSAASAKIGVFKSAPTGARLEIKDKVIEVYDENNVLRVRLGVFE